MEDKEGEEKIQVSGQEVEEKAQQYTCKECGISFATLQEYGIHVRWKHKKEVEGKKEVGVETPKPPEVETIEEAIAFIKERLPRVYGVGKNDGLIIRALEDNPTPLRDGNMLHAFIKSMAPKAYDSHISTFIVGPLYANFCKRHDLFLGKSIRMIVNMVKGMKEYYEKSRLDVAQKNIKLVC